MIVSVPNEMDAQPLPGAVGGCLLSWSFPKSYFSFFSLFVRMRAELGQLISSALKQGGMRKRGAVNKTSSGPPTNGCCLALLSGRRANEACSPEKKLRRDYKQGARALFALGGHLRVGALQSFFTLPLRCVCSDRGRARRHKTFIVFTLAWPRLVLLKLFVVVFFSFFFSR